MEELQPVHKGVHLSRVKAGVEQHREQACRGRAMPPPMLMAGRASQGRMQHLGDLRLQSQPTRQFTRRLVVGVITHPDAGQGAQDQLTVVGRHPDAQDGVGLVDTLMQRLIARDHRTHEHVSTAGRVLRQRVHGDVHAQIESIERQARTPGVVQRADRTLGFGRSHQGAQIRELHGHRTRRFHPNKACVRAQHRRQRCRVHRVIRAPGDAPATEQRARLFLRGAIDIGRQQHLVTGLEQGRVDEGDGRQAAGGQFAVQAAFQRGDALLQRVGGGRPVQSVGIALLALESSRPQSRDVLEHHRGRFVHRGRESLEPVRRAVRVVNLLRDGVGGVIASRWDLVVRHLSFVSSACLQRRFLAKLICGAVQPTVPACFRSAAPPGHAPAWPAPGPW